jgi:hypothetical protein
MLRVWLVFKDSSTCFKDLVITFYRFAKNLRGSVTLTFSVRILVYSIFPQSFL